MLLATDLVVLDHVDGSALLVSNAMLRVKPTEAARRAAYPRATAGSTR